MKRLLAFLCCFTLVFCLFPSSAFATGGNGNIDGGGGSMGHGTSSNFWNSGNDGVRITVVDASSGTAVSSPLDFSNRTQKTSLLHFGKVNKLQYLGGTGLSLQSGVAYSCIRPTQSMPTRSSSIRHRAVHMLKNRLSEFMVFSFQMLQCYRNASRGWISSILRTTNRNRKIVVGGATAIRCSKAII